MLKLSSRKFIIVLLTLMGLFYALHMGNLDATMFRDLLVLIVGGYLGANLIEKKGKKE